MRQMAENSSLKSKKCGKTAFSVSAVRSRTFLCRKTALKIPQGTLDFLQPRSSYVPRFLILIALPFMLSLQQPYSHCRKRDRQYHKSYFCGKQAKAYHRRGKKYKSRLGTAAFSPVLHTSTAFSLLLHFIQQRKMCYKKAPFKKRCFDHTV